MKNSAAAAQSEASRGRRRRRRRRREMKLRLGMREMIVALVLGQKELVQRHILWVTIISSNSSILHSYQRYLREIKILPPIYNYYFIFLWGKFI